MKPAGQSGLIAVIFLLNLPFTQVMVEFFTVTIGAGASCVSFTLMTGEEKWKLLALSESHPLCSPATVVATSLFPSEETIEIVAEMGAFEKP